jgi:hypothetical protein
MPISPAYEWSETPTTLTVTAQCREDLLHGIAVTGGPE